MAETQSEYFAAYDLGDRTKPWALFKTEGPAAMRYIPHRKAYVRMRDQWDWVAIGMSSDSHNTRPITEAQAREYEATVPEVDEELVAELEITKK